MDKRTVTGILTALLLATTAIYFALYGKVTNSCVFPVMGTICECRIDMPERKFKPALAEVRKAFDDVLKIANLHNPESELSKLNKTAHLQPFECSKELYYLLSESRKAYEISDGLFDISVKPLMDLWGFYRRNGKVPDRKEIDRVRAFCGLDKIEFNDHKRTVFFPVKGMAFDLGGIAKGYALDAAGKRLEPFAKYISRGTVNLGGNILLLGKNESYRIGIKDPASPEKIKEVVTFTSPGAVSSSGDYERYVVLDGKKYGHIIDSKNGVPAVRNYAATVFAARGIDSDWMSTVLYLGGEQISNKLNCRIIIVNK